MIHKRFLLFVIAQITFLLVCPNLDAQIRIEKPWEVKLNFHGLFFKALGEPLSNEEVTRFDTDNWLVPGFEFGYNFNRFIYLGYSFLPSRNQLLEEQWSLYDGPNDLDIQVNYESPVTHSLHLRVYPFASGFYLSSSFGLVSEADYSMDIQRLGNTATIGQGQYESDFVAEWNFRKAYSFGFGLGYNYVFQNGIALTLDIHVPTIDSPFYENITIFPTESSIGLDPNDLSIAQEILEDEVFFYPIQVNFKVGYNFDF